MKIFIDNERNASRRDRRSRRERPFARSGFTLIELLTVIAIIGMLGAISITTVRAAIESARTTQTRTTIAKIDSVITSIYEKYQYRRVDVTDYGLSGNAAATDKAWARLCVMRDLLRCDMPRCEAEVRAPSQHNGGTNGYTPLQESYLYAIKSAINAGDEDLNPELLYLVVTNGEPESRSTFSDREVADTDGDGLLEFVDGWGKPIRWLRWAPGLYRSDRQPTAYDSGKRMTQGERNLIGKNKSDADPFDPLSVIAWRLEHENDSQCPGWFLVPYVYSAGPDGEYGINDLAFPVQQKYSDEDMNLMNDPFSCLDVELKDGSDYWLGAPVSNEDGVKTYKDNIDNHTLIR